MNRKFILEAYSDIELLLKFLRSNCLSMAKQGRFLQVLVSEYKAKRSTDANSRYWAILSEIAEQAWVGGRTYSPEVWHVFLKQEYLPETCAKGVAKWDYLPDDTRTLLMHSTDLNTSEFSDYMAQVEAHGASLGVKFHEPVTSVQDINPPKRHTCGAR